ncbi:MAG TPA: glycosyltransferase family 4 protein [Planctomycetota bacterium]|nr:glycosyltransferase family 4 protein [Planctomycetota bacterium]
MHDSLDILVALQYYVPHRTGLTLHAQYVAEALAARGHRVTVLTARHDRSTPRDEEHINGVRVVRLWAPIRVSRGMVMPAYPWAAAALLARHDVVNIHTPMAETLLWAILARRLRRGLVITHHGDLVLPLGAVNRFVQWATFQLFKIAARAADRILAYSEDYRDHSYYVKPVREKTAVVHPPIRIPAPRPERVAALRREWLGEAGSRLIGYAGRFVEEKRPDVLLESLATVHRRHPGARIVFAGQYDIPYESFWRRNHALVEATSEHVRYLGLLEDPQQLADFYAACDVLALPSDTECFGLVQVEAMRCGTPVIATDIPGARIVVRKTGMGEIVPPGDPAALGEALARVLDDPDAYRKPLATIEEAFSFEETIDRYERHLRGAAESARGARAAAVRPVRHG